jgi:hypothetical protein
MHTLEQLRAGELAGLQRLDLAAGLTEFPREIFELADTLEVLNLSANSLSTWGDYISCGCCSAPTIALLPSPLYWGSARS